MQHITKAIAAFVREDNGSEVVEYALIIAVVSIGLVVALGDASSGIRSSFATLVTRVTTCFTAGSTCS
ncbi:MULTISPECIES: Flp family type IVb pilin [Ramlibacter]|uniref:Flp family type IVb pilin n=1 Tax=Ramlibacter aquaticus TaxID=2780094 RepID=A0ABR9SJ33_9BURK|nr:MULTISPECIES: Flp family type IVb pilin [Ramlibacter]MBE7942381.1 Flp family type IVb pilin [Ramlibacter aquaticus]